MFGNLSDLLQNTCNELEFVSGRKQGFAVDSEVPNVKTGQECLFESWRVREKKER